MRFVVALLLALTISPLAAPVARAVTNPGADHSCCPDSAPDAATAPCQYLAALGCCEQVMAPPSVSAGAPALRLLASAVALASPAPVLVLGPPAPSRRGDHGPPQAPLLRAVVLQL